MIRLTDAEQMDKIQYLFIIKTISKEKIGRNFFSPIKESRDKKPIASIIFNHVPFNVFHV